jgi:hypothetical protein
LVTIREILSRQRGPVQASYQFQGDVAAAQLVPDETGRDGARGGTKVKPRC